MSDIDHFRAWPRAAALGLAALGILASVGAVQASSNQSPANLPLLVLEGGSSSGLRAFSDPQTDDLGRAFAELTEQLGNAPGFDFARSGIGGGSARGVTGGRAGSTGGSFGGTSPIAVSPTDPTVNPSPVPLPASAVLLFGCLSALALVGLRRRSRA